MTPLEFIASVIGHLAWPATFIFALLTLKRPIAGLIPKIRRAKWGDGEVEFGEQIEVVRAEVEQLPETKEGIKALPAPMTEALPAATPPSLVVMYNYGLIEEEIASLARVSGLAEPAAKSTIRGVFELLRQQNVIDVATYNALMDLRRLRNLAAHKSDRQISDAEAAEFVGVARTVRARLAWIRERLVQGQ